MGSTLVLALLAAGASARAACCAEPALPANLRETAAEIGRRGLASDRAHDLVHSLVVEVGPRFAGSPGDRRAVEWALRTLRELGFDEVRAEPVTVPRWDRGYNGGVILSPFEQPVELTALGGSVPTPPGGLTALVLRVESLTALGALPEGDAAGRIVFIDEPMERTRDASGYVRAVAKRGRGAVEAAKKGASGLLIRSAGTSTDRIAHTGGMRYEEGVPRIPAAALSNPDADLLAAQMASGRPVTFRFVLDTRVLPDGESANVVGELRGRERPGEIVLLAAHLDSWDLGQGAVDDGAGCATVLAAARLLADLPRRPRRTVRVVLFANEEFGLSGARAYAESHAGELARHMGALESDLGSGAVWRFSSLVAPDRLPVVAEIAALLAPLGLEQGGNDAFGGADLSPLRPARVPFFNLLPDTTAYFDVHHTINDTLSQIDPAGLRQAVAAHALLAYVLAEWEGDWGRAPEPAEQPGR